MQQIFFMPLVTIFVMFCWQLSRDQVIMSVSVLFAVCVVYVHVCVCVSVYFWRAFGAVVAICVPVKPGSVAGLQGDQDWHRGRSWSRGQGRWGEGRSRVRPGRWQLRWMNILILANRLHIWAMAMPSTAMTCAWTCRGHWTAAGHEVKQRFRRWRWRWRRRERGQALE